MKIFISVILAAAILFGCGRQEDGVSVAMDLRQRLLIAEKSSFDAVITADYGDRMYTFNLACVVLNNGAVEFTVVSPHTIAGIAGSVSDGTGKLIFDDTVLLFEPLTQGQLTPIIGPWLMFKAILGGYIRSVANLNGQYEITIDDSFKSECFQTILTLDTDHNPLFCEIFWNERRILSIQISNYSLL